MPIIPGGSGTRPSRDLGVYRFCWVGIVGSERCRGTWLDREGVVLRLIKIVLRFKKSAAFRISMGVVALLNGPFGEVRVLTGWWF